MSGCSLTQRLRPELEMGFNSKSVHVLVHVPFMYFKGNHAENSRCYDLSGNETHSSLCVSVFVRVVIQDTVN